MPRSSLPTVFADDITGTPDYSQLHPDQKALPGGDVASGILGGLTFYALLFTLAGLSLSAGVWAVGSFSSNYSQQVNGKKSFLICLASALFIGAAYNLVTWFYDKGTTI